MIKEALEYLSKQNRKPVTVYDANGVTRTLDYEGMVVTDETAARQAARPLRAKGTRYVHSLTDLTYLANRLGDEPVIYADLGESTITCVLNDDISEDAAGWRDQRVLYNFIPSTEWNLIRRELNNYPYQTEFVDYVETISPFIVDPEPAIMLEIASSLQAARSAKIENAVRTKDGNIRMQWIEETTGTAGATGDLEIPNHVTVHVPVFENMDPVSLNLAFRYRVNRGEGVRMGFFMPTYEVVARRAQLDAIDDLMTGDIPVILGSAPTPNEVVR